MKNISFRLDEDIYWKIVKYAEDHDLKLSNAMRQIVDEYFSLKPSEKEFIPPLARIAEMEKRINEYMAGVQQQLQLLNSFKDKIEFEGWQNLRLWNEEKGKND